MSTQHTKDRDEDDSSIDDDIPPRIRPRSIYDSESRTSLIQATYDQHHLHMKAKKLQKEKKLANKEKQKKKQATEMHALQKACRKKEEKEAAREEKVRQRKKSKYEIQQPPGQIKITSFATPVSTTPSLSTPSTSTSTRTYESSVSFCSNGVNDSSIKSPRVDICTTTCDSQATTTCNSQATNESNDGTQTNSCPAFASPSASTSASSSSTTNKGHSTKLARCLGVCSGCHMQWHLCLEAKHRDHCLHAVVDYFDVVGYDAITPHGICIAFYKKYLSRVKDDLLTTTGYHELKDDIPIPECML